MKRTYFIIVNKNIEIIKLISYILLIIFYRPIYKLLVSFLNKQFTQENIHYVGRLLFVILFCVLTILVKCRFSDFARKNWESLILIGIDAPKNFLLFFFINYSGLFLMIYFGSMLCCMMEINVFTAILLNSILVYLIGILIGIKKYTKIHLYLLLIFAGILAMLFGTGTLTYANTYHIIMSTAAKQILFSCSFISFVIKFVFSICMFFSIMYEYKISGVVPLDTLTGLCRQNIFGDFAHLLSKYSVGNKQYIWLYKNKDYVLWKVFSSIVLLLIGLSANSNIVVFLSAYVVTLISTFYYCDIYSFDRELLFLYYMSNYPYEKFLKNNAIYGVLILGDNISVILLMRCFIHPGSLIILFFILLAMIFVALFISSQLYLKYPLKQNRISVVLALVKMHLPILNIAFLYKNLKHGKKNWENISYDR